MSAYPARSTLPRAGRLQQRNQFARTLAAGAVGIRRHFALYACPNGLARARLGIIAGRRAGRHAVDRNRAKRLVREVFRMNRHQLGGVDIVVKVRRCPAREASAAARSELAKLFAGIGTPLTGRDI